MVNTSDDYRFLYPESNETRIMRAHLVSPPPPLIQAQQIYVHSKTKQMIKIIILIGNTRHHVSNFSIMFDESKASNFKGTDHTTQKAAHTLVRNTMKWIIEICYPHTQEVNASTQTAITLELLAYIQLHKRISLDYHNTLGTKHS